MYWDAISAIFTAIGAVAALIGLPILGWQLRNLGKQQKAAAQQDIVDGERALWEIALSDDKMTAALVSHFLITAEDLQAADATPQMALMTMLFFRQYENLFYRHKSGVLPADLWKQWEYSMRRTFGSAAIQALFEKARPGFTEGFQEFVDRLAQPHG